MYVGNNPFPGFFAGAETGHLQLSLRGTGHAEGQSQLHAGP